MSDTPITSAPQFANFPSSKIVFGAGVAIFHLASARVVICYHPSEGGWFLPKGRRDIHETTERGAEREGFEESGYRNRLLPIPLKHRQPLPHSSPNLSHAELATEPIWTQFLPQSRTAQYVLFWYIAETLPPSIEKELSEASQAQSQQHDATPYHFPPPFPLDLSMKARLQMENTGYVPPRHEGTGVDEEEAEYQSYLVDIDVAIERLGRRSVQGDVIRVGWQAIRQRFANEGVPLPVPETEKTSA